MNEIGKITSLLTDLDYDTSLITLVLSSTVIVGIIGFIQWRHDKKLKHITEERKSWRNDMRKIAEDLQLSKNNDELDGVLTRLKVRINTLGYYINDNDNCKEKDDYFKSDLYLWELINSLEDSSNTDFSTYKVDINKLILSISLLLKYDWERSKNEVKLIKGSDKYLMIVSSLLFVYTIYIFQNDIYSLIFHSSFILFYIIILLTCKFIYIFFKKKTKSEYSLSCATKANLIKYCSMLTIVILCSTNVIAHRILYMCFTNFFDTQTYTLTEYIISQLLTLTIILLPNHKEPAIYDYQNIVEKILSKENKT